MIAKSLDRALRSLGLMAASAAAIATAMVVFSANLRQQIAQPLACIVGGVGVILFLRMLLDPKVRRAIDHANREIGANQFKFRWIPLSDLQWGLFGRKVGDGFLLFVRAGLLVELLISMLLSKIVGREPVLLAFSGMMVATLLCLIQLGDRPSGADQPA